MGIFDKMLILWLKLAIMNFGSFVLVMDGDFLL